MKSTFVLCYLLSFNPGSPSQPITFHGPYLKAECELAARVIGGWCQDIHVPKGMKQ